jgi:hypothetical protein
MQPIQPFRIAKKFGAKTRCAYIVRRSPLISSKAWMHSMRRNASGKRRALAGSIITESTVLEDDLQSQLHVERFARPDAWSAVVVADGIRGNSQTAAGQASAIALQG